MVVVVLMAGDRNGRGDHSLFASASCSSWIGHQGIWNVSRLVKCMNKSLFFFFLYFSHMFVCIDYRRA